MRLLRYWTIILHFQNFKLVKVEGQRCYAEYDDLENRVIRSLRTFKLGHLSIRGRVHGRIVIYLT